VKIGYSGAAAGASGWLALCILALFLAACASSPQRDGAYTVRQGDTLYSIAMRYRLDYRVLARWNGIGRDYRIYPGQRLRLTPPSGKQERVAKAPPAKTPPRPAISAGPPVDWRWPAQGQTFERTERPNGGQGLTIHGNLHQSIHAAGAGRVVYTGSGLLGYGQLLIIKHNETYLSAYGHTASMLVREGDEVRAGQQVATMGAGTQGRAMLYFEIRVDGKPVDPLPLLPSR
jgi:lipoprotein NlpD